MDRAGLEQALREHHEAAWGWALACCRRDRDLAEEVLQMAWTSVLDGSARFDGRSRFRTWFFGVIRRIAAGQRRRRARRSLLAGRFGLVTAARPALPGPDETLARDETARRVAGALARLSDRQREVLHLVFYEEMTIEQAARCLGLRLGTARTHYERGKRQLRRLLDGEEPR